MPVKIKIFAVVMAVMLCMSCMCVTAFAEDIYVQNGVAFQGSFYSDSDWTVLKVEQGVTYTITTDADISSLGVVYCYDGYIENRTLYFVDGVCEYTCDDASLTGIALHSPTGGDAIDFTVTWPQPSSLDIIIDSIGLLFTSALFWVVSAANAVAASPILLLFTVLPLVGLGVGIFYRLKG